MQSHATETDRPRHQARAHETVSSSDVSSMGRVSQTALLTLSGRAHDAATAEPILGDRWAIEMLARLPDAGRAWSMINRFFYPGIALRSLLYDQWTRHFLDRNPDATVLHLACGLDTRALRLSPLEPGVRWFDVDVPEVVALRRRLLSSEPDAGEYHLIDASVLDPALLEFVPGDRPALVIMEGLLPYLSTDGVLDLMRRLAERFPSGQIVCDFPSGRFAWLRYLPVPVFKVVDLFGFTSDDGRELAGASDRLLLTDSFSPGQLPNRELLPWYLRILGALSLWIPFLRVIYSVCRFEIREPSRSVPKT